MFYEIQMLILRSLLAVQRAMMNDKHCVEMCAPPLPLLQPSAAAACDM